MRDLVTRHLLVRLDRPGAVAEVELAMDRVHREVRVVSHRVSPALAFLLFVAVVEVAGDDDGDGDGEGGVSFEAGDGWEREWVPEAGLLGQVAAAKGDNDMNLVTKVVAKAVAGDMGWAGAVDGVWIPGESAVKRVAAEDAVARREDVCTCRQCGDLPLPLSE